MANRHPELYVSSLRRFSRRPGSGGTPCFDGRNLVKLLPESTKSPTNIWETVEGAEIRRRRLDDLLCDSFFNIDNLLLEFFPSISILFRHHQECPPIGLHRSRRFSDLIQKLLSFRNAGSPSLEFMDPVCGRHGDLVESNLGLVAGGDLNLGLFQGQTSVQPSRRAYAVVPVAPHSRRRPMQWQCR
jgi:hypothetical protein